MGLLIPCRLVEMYVHPQKSRHCSQAVESFFLTKGEKPWETTLLATWNSATTCTCTVGEVVAKASDGGSGSRSGGGKSVSESQVRRDVAPAMWLSFL